MGEVQADLDGLEKHLEELYYRARQGVRNRNLAEKGVPWVSCFIIFALVISDFNCNALSGLNWVPDENSLWVQLLSVPPELQAGEFKKPSRTAILLLCATLLLLWRAFFRASPLIQVSIRVVTGAVFILLVGILFESHCGGTTESNICGAVRENPPWTLLSALGSTPVLIYIWRRRREENDRKLQIEEQKANQSLLKEWIEKVSHGSPVERQAAVANSASVAGSVADIKFVNSALQALIRMRGEMGLSPEEIGETVSSLIQCKNFTIDLSGSDLSNVLIRDVSFCGASLHNCDFSGATFIECNFDGADLQGCNLEGTKFPNSTMSGETGGLAKQTFLNKGGLFLPTRLSRSRRGERLSAKCAECEVNMEYLRASFLSYQYRCTGCGAERWYGYRKADGEIYEQEGPDSIWSISGVTLLVVGFVINLFMMFNLFYEPVLSMIALTMISLGVLAIILGEARNVVRLQLVWYVLLSGTISLGAQKILGDVILVENRISEEDNQRDHLPQEKSRPAGRLTGP